MPEPKILVDMVFFIRNVLPVLHAMGWTVRYGVRDAPRGQVVIHGIRDKTTLPDGFRVSLNMSAPADEMPAEEKVTEEEGKIAKDGRDPHLGFRLPQEMLDRLDSLVSNGQAKTRSEAARTILCGSLNGDTVEPLIRPELREKFTRILDALAAPLNHAEGKLKWHYAGDEDKLESVLSSKRGAWDYTLGQHNIHYGDGAIGSALRQKPAATPRPESDSRDLPPLEAPALAAPVFDYTTLREDPENDRRLRDYSNHMIVVESRHMVETVKPDFATRGWIYGGNHYGDGSVGFSVVLDTFTVAGIQHDRVVAPAAVVAALGALQVPHRIHHRRPEPADRVVEYDYEDGEMREDGRPLSLDAAEAERQEAMEAATEAEEEELEPLATVSGSTLEDVPGSQLDATGALRLEEGEKMYIRGEYIHATQGAELTLEIGDNVITVVSTYKQADEFLAEASALAAQIISDRERNLEEAESDGGKARDDFTEQG